MKELEKLKKYNYSILYFKNRENYFRNKANDLKNTVIGRDMLKTAEINKLAKNRIINERLKLFTLLN